MFEILIKYINNKIIDVRMKNMLNEYIEDILKNNGKIKINPHIEIKNKNKKLLIKKNKNHIKYIYINNKYKEKYEIYKIKKESISEYKNNNIKQISVFQEEKEMLKHIEEKNQEATYIRTKKNNIILIEKMENKIKKYIGINENKYENYLPNNTIFTEIEEQDYMDLIKRKIEEEKILEKYLTPVKKLHLQ